MKTATKNCLTCQKEFTADYRKKFCNSSCAATFNNKIIVKRKLEGECLACAKLISSSRKFCSKECRIKHPRKKTAEYKTSYQKVTVWRQRLKLKALIYKGNCCVVCGYNKCAGALHFHHLDPKEKEFRIGSGNTRGWEIVKKELDKCILLCANCHAEEHNKL